MPFSCSENVGKSYWKYTFTGPWNSFDTLANCKEVKIDKIYIFMAKTLQNRRKI